MVWENSYRARYGDVLCIYVWYSQIPSNSKVTTHDLTSNELFIVILPEHQSIRILHYHVAKDLLINTS